MARKDPESQREYMRKYRADRKRQFADVTEGSKVCSTCNVEKSLEAFHRHPSGKYGRAEACKPCRQDRDRLRKFGVTPEDYERLCTNGCHICGRTDGNRLKRLSVDHCHDTGRVRGVLCSNCNTLIGLANDDPELLVRAADYLSRSTTRASKLVSPAQ